MAYLRSQLPHNPDFPTVAEELRKLIKRTDEIERESKIAQQKISQYEKDIVKLNNRCDTYGHKIQELEGKNLVLENRCKALDHNALARLKNSRVANPEHVLTPLKDAGTNLPIQNFPKHEKDIRVMGASEVRTTLTALDQPTTGTPGEQKTRLREAVGRDISTATKSLGEPKPADAAPEADGANGAKTPAKRPQPKREMSVQQKKLEGIKAARAKLAQNKMYGGAADPRVRKSKEGSVVEEKKGEGMVNGAG